MSTVVAKPAPAFSSEPVFRLSVEQYHAMIDAGVLTDDDPVELLEGLLVYKMPKKPIHPLTVRLLTTAIDGLLGPQLHFRAQEPVTLDDSEPEPDGAVVRGSPRDYTDQHPGRDDVVLVIEIADATAARDRGIKLRTYARAGIAVYWIVNLPERCVEVYTGPDSSQEPAGYRDRRVHAESESVDVIIDGKSVGAIRVRDILP